MEVLQNGVELLHQLILLFFFDLDAGKPADVLNIFPGDHVIPHIKPARFGSYDVFAILGLQAKDHLIRYKGSF